MVVSFNSVISPYFSSMLSIGINEISMLGLAEKDTKNSYYSCIACAQKAKQKLEHTKKTQTKLLEMKTTISKMEKKKNTCPHSTTKITLAWCEPGDPL